MIVGITQVRHVEKMGLRSDDIVRAVVAGEGDGSCGIANVEAPGRVTVLVILMVGVVPNCRPMLEETRRACLFAACEESFEVAVR